VLKRGLTKVHRAGYASAQEVDRSCLTRLYLDSTAQQLEQYLGAHLPAVAPMFPACRIIVLLAAGQEVNWCWVRLFWGDAA
jgi:hypothetical protein